MDYIILVKRVLRLVVDLDEFKKKKGEVVDIDNLVEGLFCG